MQAEFSSQSRFSEHGSAGDRMQAIFAVGLGTMPFVQEQLARWLETVQIALGPHGLISQGFMHLLFKHDSLPLQSSSLWHPKTHLLCRQMWPRKQSLSTRQVRTQFPEMHFSFKAQSWSEPQTGMHIVSAQVLPSEQSVFDEQATGIRTHSMSEFPVKPAGQVHCFSCRWVRHSAFIPQACCRSHGFMH